MNTERDELLERVAYLEKRTSDQAEELTCLKSALADCLRRVQLLESSRGTHSPTRRIAPRTASESRAIRAGTAIGGSRQMALSGSGGGRHVPRLPSNVNAGVPISQRPPSQASLRSGNPTSPSSTATAPPGFKGSSGTIGRPPTSNSKGGFHEVFRKRSNTAMSIISLLTHFGEMEEDPLDPSSWNVIYGLPASRGLLQQRTLIHESSAPTKYSTDSRRSRRNSLPFKSASPNFKWSLQVSACSFWSSL
ncbi:unnamed protein product [Hymenolepis diminuta]|uniref:SLAIN motif-containing protein 2 n=1 Tax=Hymenolepis diminuta TaxID=6216 RepID=A0A0R3SDF8_HYMDI|nr:unnamed protein product [Hymenolepis diminuta]